MFWSARKPPSTHQKRRLPKRRAVFFWTNVFRAKTSVWFQFGLNWFKSASQPTLKPLPRNASVILRLHSGEEQHITDGAAVSQQHHHSVNAITDTARGGQDGLVRPSTGSDTRVLAIPRKLHCSLLWHYEILCTESSHDHHNTWKHEFYFKIEVRLR